jgi:transcriptional regulator with XRE-family HTH domain
MEYRVVGENIRKFRKRLKLTQDELADRVGVTWEMVSRYERGQNSPMNKLSSIAEALSVSIGDLVDVGNENVYQIPLFVRMPKDMIFSKENTQVYYISPTWIIKLDPESFAIDSSLVESSTYISNKGGLLFISSNSDLNINDLIVVIENGKLLIEKYSMKSKKVVGKILMQEIVY